MRGERNLLEETIEVMQDHSKVPDDVEWVGMLGDDYSQPLGWCTWEEFASVADARYYPGFGCQEVVSDLVVCGEDWWLERHEYDGSEWWEFKTVPDRPKDQVVPKRVTGASWETASEFSESNRA